MNKENKTDDNYLKYVAIGAGAGGVGVGSAAAAKYLHGKDKKRK